MPFAKNKKSFLELFEKHKSMAANVIYNICPDADVEGLTQETFLKVWRALPAFSFKSSHKTWIYRIAVNTALDEARKNKSGAALVDRVELLGEESGFEKKMEERDLVSAAMRALSANERAALVLSVFEEVGYKEMSKILDAPEGTLKARVSGAKKKMKKRIEEILNGK